MSLRIKELFLQHGFEYHIAAKQYVGWHEQQEWQVRFLFRHGLKPSHNFLDIGCGWLRLGYALVPYLEPGRYFGIEAEQVHLDIGEALLEEAHRLARPTLLCDREFSFEKFQTTFDFTFCHAVFTHLSHAQIRTCLTNLKAVMTPQGVGYFTCYLADKADERLTVYKRTNGNVLTFTTSQVSLRFLSGLFRELKLPWRYLGTEGHPTGHHVIEVRFGPTARHMAGLAGAVSRATRHLRVPTHALSNG